MLASHIFSVWSQIVVYWLNKWETIRVCIDFSVVHTPNDKLCRVLWVRLVSRDTVRRDWGTPPKTNRETSGKRPNIVPPFWRNVKQFAFLENAINEVYILNFWKLFRIDVVQVYLWTLIKDRSMYNRRSHAIETLLVNNDVKHEHGKPKRLISFLWLSSICFKRFCYQNKNEKRSWPGWNCLT